MSSPLIEIEDVSVFRENTTILHSISLSIPRGRHTAILGPNGSGKSSLLKLLTRDFYPSVPPSGQQGRIRILGESEWEVSKLRRRMGIVTPVLDAEFSKGRTGRMTVGEAVASGFTATRLKSFGPTLDTKMKSAVSESIETVGMTDLTNRRLDSLSTGERRRAMIARSIVHQPEVFVLDEPTNGLDMTSRVTFLEILNRLTQSNEMTLVLVTHHIDEIPPQIKHAVLLDQGKVTFDGPKDKGITAENISSLFRAKVDVTQCESGWYRAELPAPK